MYKVSAHAVRVGNTVEVTVYGFLPDSCHEASITDIYPGGKIMYVRDPGHAQVFITETSKPNMHFCTLALVPFISTVYIQSSHKEVQVLVNHSEVLQVKIMEKGETYQVIRLTGGFVPNGHCSIVPAQALFPQIYTKVFGPDSYDNCYEWVVNNCHFGESQLLFSFAGKGGESPRGLL